jgi:uncharacterized protein with FMN-binding domain
MTQIVPPDRPTSVPPGGGRLSTARRGQRHRIERRLPSSALAVAAAAAGLVILLRHPMHNAANAGQVGALSPSTPAAAAQRGSAGLPTAPVRNGVVTGRPVDTDFGPMQVRITIANGKITATRAVQVTSAGKTSERINQRSLPVLYRETIAGQSARVDSISGATVTCTGYKQALQSAIDAAHLA